MHTWQAFIQTNLLGRSFPCKHGSHYCIIKVCQFWCSDSFWKTFRSHRRSPLRDIPDQRSSARNFPSLPFQQCRIRKTNSQEHCQSLDPTDRRSHGTDSFFTSFGLKHMPMTRRGLCRSISMKHEVPLVIPLVIMKRRAVELPNLLKYQLAIQRSLPIVGATCV